LIQKGFDIFIPNAFAPNGEVEENRKLCIEGFGISNLKFSIYNRWGEEVFTIDSPNSEEWCWNGKYKGKIQDTQTFGYIIEAENFEGTTKTYKGTIVLIK
jgi:gliding motility-associated-like protein